MPSDPDAERHAELRALYAEVVDLPEADRSQAVDRLVADGDPIREPLMALLSRSEPPMLDRPIVDDADAGRDAGPIPSRGPAELPSVPGCVVLEPIGEGGMGTVYRAEQESPRREVAVKVVKRGLDTD